MVLTPFSNEPISPPDSILMGVFSLPSAICFTAVVSFCMGSMTPLLIFIAINAVIIKPANVIKKLFNFSFSRVR